VKDEKSGVFPDVDAVECRKIRFKPIFSAIQREKTKNGIVVG
jgi:hypothetical protein